MFAVLSLLLIVSLSLLVTRVASVALVHTGLSRESARFQARSAFAGVGFTTSEAESVVRHPVRRRIVMWLMLAGNVGIVTAMSSLLLSFFGMGRDAAGWPVELGVLAGGITLLWLLSASAWIDARLCRLISWGLNRFTSVDARDYARLLHLREDYGVSELRVEEGDWLSGKTVGEADLNQEGLLVLGIHCPNDRYVGAPGPDIEIRARDVLTLYGRTPRIAELDARTPGSQGDGAHAEASREHERLSGEESRQAGR